MSECPEGFDEVEEAFFQALSCVDAGRGSGWTAAGRGGRRDGLLACAWFRLREPWLLGVAPVARDRGRRIACGPLVRLVVAVATRGWECGLERGGDLDEELLAFLDGQTESLGDLGQRMSVHEMVNEQVPCLARVREALQARADGVSDLDLAERRLGHLVADYFREVTSAVFDHRSIE
ncbi:hypothetical protein ACW9HJ_07975 [Nocardia gipuzkoensis]